MFSAERKGSSLTSIKPDATAAQPGVSLLRRLPDTLSGPVRIRRRRRLFREWTPATASLKGTALIVFARDTKNVISAVDVHIVEHLKAKSPTQVIVRSCTGLSVQLRFEALEREWLTALRTIADGTGPKLSDFSIVAPVGKGGGGEVYLVKKKDDIDAQHSNSPLALKVVQKHDAFHSDGSLRHALDERLVTELVRGFPFVIRLTHAFQTQTALYMVSEFCQGGNLRTLLNRSKGNRLSEQMARPIMAQIILAIEHIHSLNVIYRDLKPDNVLFDTNGNVRLCDFGLSKVLSTGRFGRTKSFCGSTSYMSPQIVTGKWYGIDTDMWSLGALFYRMLVGRAPFDDNPHKLGARNEPADIQKRIQLDDITFPSFLSSAAVEMLEGLLRKNEEERLNMQDLKEGLFFEGVDWDKVLEDGYEQDALPRPVAVQNDDTLHNFDPDRLISHGIRLEDDELVPKQRKRHAAVGTGFKSRKTSMLGLRVRQRSEMHKVQNSTSIVGFGYSYASASDLSTIRSDFSGSSTDTSSSKQH